MVDRLVVDIENKHYLSIMNRKADKITLIRKRGRFFFYKSFFWKAVGNSIEGEMEEEVLGIIWALEVEDAVLRVVRVGK